MFHKWKKTGSVLATEKEDGGAVEAEIAVCPRSLGSGTPSVAVHRGDFKAPEFGAPNKRGSVNCLEFGP